MKYILLILPLAACGPHVERCLTFPLPVGCSQSGGGGLSLLTGGNVPPRPEPGPEPAPEPQPEPKPEPEPPKPDHDDDKDDHDAHDDADSGDEADDEDEDDGEDTGDRYGSSTHGEADDD